MTNISLILFDLNVMLPLALLGTTLLTAILFLQIKKIRLRFYRIMLSNESLIEKSFEKVNNIVSDRYLTCVFFFLLFAKLCLRAFIIYKSSK